MTEAISFTAPVVSVDSANKIQNGDDLYMGLFQPQDSQSWVGNLKKFKLGDGSAQRPDPWMLYDGANNEAISSSGEFMDNMAAFWGDDADPNDSDSYGGQDVKEDGAGEVLLERVQADFASGNYYERPILYLYRRCIDQIRSNQYQRRPVGRGRQSDPQPGRQLCPWIYL